MYKILIFLLYPILSASQFTSPCPNLFTYDNIESDNWSGSLHFTLEAEYVGLWIQVLFDRPFTGLISDFGEVVYRENEPNKYLIRRPSPKVDAGTSLNIKITAENNPTLGAPQLLGFRINGKTFCPENGEIPPPPPPESFLASTGDFVSPCPAGFIYEPLTPGSNRWYANVNVKSDTELSGVWMRFVLDKPPVDFGANFGISEQKEPSDFLIKNPKHHVNAGDTIQFRVYAEFIPGETPPKLLGYRLNAKTVCPANGHIEKPTDNLVSVCPSIFQYEPGVEPGRWNGIINVVSTVELSGVWMRIIFDKPITELGTEFGEVKRRGDGDFLIKNPQHTLKIGESLKFRISPQFTSSNPSPRLIGIRLNARTVCPEDGQVETTTLSVAQQLISPCPKVFSYNPSTETDRWYGTLNLMTSKELSGVWLRIILDKHSVQLGVSDTNWFGEVKTEDNILYKIQRRDYKLSPGTTVPLKFFIRYNSAEALPKLKEIKLNGETICPEPPNAIPNSGAVGIPTQNSIINTATTPPTRPGGGRPVFKPDWGGAFKPPVATEGTVAECGYVASQPIPLVWGGTVTEEGQWPWHAALYYTGGAKPEYYCGAVLISLRYVLTAAHCVAEQGTRNPINGRDVLVHLGKYLLEGANKGVQYLQIDRVNIHSNYDVNTYANDIAVLRLSRPAEYNNYVRPVCLWSENTDLSSVENKEGTVVGWGYDNRGLVTDKLLKAVMPVVSHRRCIWSNKQFYKRVLNDGNFCAGFRNGTSVCTGDSGGGLVFPMGPNRWQVRGLVSLSVALQDSTSACDTSHYVVFTDVAKFLPWIQQQMN